MVIHSKLYPKSHFIENLRLCLKRIAYLCTEIAIYALFVDNNHRKCGVAKHLLQLAEQQAKLNGVKIIGLEFNKDESEKFVLNWYLNNGYKPFSKESNLLIKTLED